MLKAIDLTKRYEDGLLALDRLNLEVATGQCYALLGANGAGKTTTINLFLGFLTPTSGQALVNGIDVAREPLSAKRFVAYLPESVMLYANLTAEQNLRFFASLSGHELGRDEIVSLFREVGLQEKAWRQRLREFSKGMRQKVGIAIAIAKDAPALLLDEPTSGLDPQAASDTLNSIAGLIQIEPRRAEELVEELADLLRYRFRVAREFIPLAEELSLVNSYLEIEQVRLGARMRIERDIEPEALAVPVPPLVLQPLVENAVTHGVARKVEGGCVRVSARVRGERLELRVEDDGNGMPLDLMPLATEDESSLQSSPGDSPSYGGKGVGLANVLDRLQRIYGSSARAEVSSEVGRGTCIDLDLPIVPPAALEPST